MSNENERNESFIFYASFDEALSELDDAQYGKIMRAINKYAIYGTEPELTGVLKAMFILIKPQLDANMRRRTKGNTGGRPTIDDDTRNAITDDLLAGETYQDIAERHDVSIGTVSNIKKELPDFQKPLSDFQKPFSFSKTIVNEKNGFQKPNDNVNVNENVNENANENERGGQAPAEVMPAGTQTPSPPKKQTRFVKPTVEEVAAYCKQRGNNIDAAAFVNFYESKGWYIGKNKMQNWHAAVYTWEKRAHERTRASPQNKTHSADYDFNTAGDVGEPLF